jgi:hypothetical protein
LTRRRVSGATIAGRLSRLATVEADTPAARATSRMPVRRMPAPSATAAPPAFRQSLSDDRSIVMDGARRLVTFASGWRVALDSRPDLFLDPPGRHCL